MASTKKKIAAPEPHPASTKTGPAGRTFLVGDVGGTRSRLALHVEGSKKPVAERVVPSQEHASFEEIAEKFLAETGAARPVAAAFGIAGPVNGGVATTTNLPWKIDERVLVRRLGITRVRLYNDLVVGARGCLEVSAREVEVLTPKPPAKKGANIGVIAAGTGLGEARLVWTGDRYLPLATEGGHGDFAPRTPIEVELFHFLGKRFPDHVSYERVISGAGLGVLYDFFVARSGKEPQTVAKKLAAGDRNAVIAELGLARSNRAAAQAVDLFALLYGAEAGNLALRELALGGIYVIGNIGKNIIPARRELFLQGFLAKGRFGKLLSAVPIAVVRDSMVGLRGALALARELGQP